MSPAVEYLEKFNDPSELGARAELAPAIWSEGAVTSTPMGDLYYGTDSGKSLTVELGDFPFSAWNATVAFDLVFYGSLQVRLRAKLQHCRDLQIAAIPCVVHVDIGTPRLLRLVRQKVLTQLFQPC